jgi:hypothetical protein
MMTAGGVNVFATQFLLFALQLVTTIASCLIFIGDARQQLKHSDKTEYFSYNPFNLPMV